MKINQVIKGQLVQTRVDDSGDNWYKNIYQLKRKLKNIILWCDSKHIDEVSMMIVLDEIINGELKNLDGSKVGLKNRIKNQIK